jgi:hypothetical protein
MFWKAVLFWVGVLVALVMFFQLRPGSTNNAVQWSNYLPLAGLVAGLIVILWNRRKRAKAESPVEPTTEDRE